MSKKTRPAQNGTERVSPPVAPITLTEDEQWSAREAPTVEEALGGMGLVVLGSVDAPAPLRVPGPLFVKIQAADREVAAAVARRQELMELAIDLLNIERARYASVIDLDSGIVTLTPLEGAPS